MDVLGRGWRPLVALAASIAALAVLVAGGTALAGDEPVTVETGNLVVTFDGGFSPKALPKKELAPMTLTASGKIATKDGFRRPALRGAIVEADENAAVKVKGLPVCRFGQLRLADTESAKATCPKAIVGHGRIAVEIQMLEMIPLPRSSPLTVFNGGEKGGTTTLYVHAYFSAPVANAIVATVKIEKVNRGRYGLEAVATIPKIAGGEGSVKSFDLKIGRTYTYKGKRMSVLSAKCGNGKLQAFATSIFADGTEASAGVVRTCTAKG